MTGREVLTQEQLKAVLRYDPATGAFVWRVRTSKRIRVGAVAGNLSRGYVDIRVYCRLYRAQRLAWLYMTGEWPDEVDHHNGIHDDNRWRNLRNGSHQFNCQNIRAPKSHNTTGFLGVVRKYRRFKAQICINSKTTYLGSFETAGAAHAAYLEAKRKHHPGCTI